MSLRLLPAPPLGCRPQDLAQAAAGVLVGEKWGTLRAGNPKTTTQQKSPGMTLHDMTPWPRPSDHVGRVRGTGSWTQSG